MTRLLLVHMGVLCSLVMSAQVHNLFVNDNVDRRVWDQSFERPDLSFHTAIRGYEGKLNVDSSLLKIPEFLHKSILPLLDLSVSGIISDTLIMSSQTLGGLGYSSRFGKKWQVDLAVLGGFAFNPSHEEIHTQTAGVLEGYGRTEVNTSHYSFWDINGRVRFDASEHFSFSLGKAKNFFGDGFRSTFLSENAAPYPYFRIDTKVWHLHYVNLFSWQQGMLYANGPASSFESKYTSTHVLSWNISELFNVQLFETIIWQGEDSLSNRGYDVAYLNPIIFYRPVEFSSGSADNAILGIAASIRIWPRYQWYTQITLDEFLLDEFKNKTGWWGNKYAFQMGLKGKDFAGIEGLYMQAEMNLARPFTFSHGSPIQSYTHLNQSLAHPLGSNFFEYLLIANYQKESWELRGLFSFSKQGSDQFGANLGGDILRSYVNPFQNFTNIIGQGLATEVYRSDLRLSYILDPTRDIRIQLGYDYRYYGGEIDHESVHGIQVAIRSSLGDGYR